MKSRVVFADAKTRDSYQKLIKKPEGSKLYRWLMRAIDDVAEDAFCGIQIPKRQIPKDYTRKYGIDNLWKYNLPEAWRLLYSVARHESMVLSIIIDLNHTEYERKFKY